MLYIYERCFSEQIDFIEYLSASELYDFIIWFFPESVSHDVCELPLADKIEGEPVTTYFDGTYTAKTKRMPLDAKLVLKIRKEEKKIRENCDSIALYRHDEKEWYACTIFHERICLVQDETLQEKLRKINFEAKNQEPEWW